MTEIYLGRDYSATEQAKMRVWCVRNSLGAYTEGSSIFAAATIVIRETPWCFERKEDATLFALTWM